MELLFEKSRTGRSMDYMPASDVGEYSMDASLQRKEPIGLPDLAEVDLTRHYTALAKRVYGVNCGFYPLGSCTMKYNPAVNETAASLPGFTGIRPRQPASTVQGCLGVLTKAGKALCEITGMDDMSFQPAAGAHGEFTGLLLIKAYHDSRGEGDKRKVILVPDSAHGTNPASSAMADFRVVSIPSLPDGGVDLDALRAAAGEDTAGLMLTNPNTVGIFDKNILEITKIVHEAGGLTYYDGANLNAVMGKVRPGDMGFDVIHLNLHKTFSTPHGGGGPGAGPCGCKVFLAKFLPKYTVTENGGVYGFANPAQTVGCVRSFYGNFLVVVRALAYIEMLGAKGIREAAEGAVVNANYLKTLLSKDYQCATKGWCMHEFVLDIGGLKHKTGVNAMDVAKALVDMGIHPPTMYFPLIVHEALMIEPTETESKDTLDSVATAFHAVREAAEKNPEALHTAPHTTPIGRPDEVAAARKPVLVYKK